jgi:hypothetical protein
MMSSWPIDDNHERCVAMEEPWSAARYSGVSVET